MPAWLGDLLRLLSVGGSTQWFGLVCPVHCTVSLPYLLSMFCAGVCLGILGTVFSAEFSWGLGLVAIPPASLPPPPSGSVLLLGCQPTCMSALSVLITSIRTVIVTLRFLADGLEAAAHLAEH